MPPNWSTSPGWPVAGVDLHLELRPGEGLRQGLESALRSAVRSGVLAAGSRLPATRVLAAELGISRGTVSAAYDQLVAEGYLLARHGSATTVAPVPGLSRRPASRPSARPRHELRAGTPDVTAFPVAAWLRSARRALNSAPATAFGYAADRRGRPELRAALADYLGRARGVAASAERIVITAGYAQALALLALALGPGRIAMEDPGLPYHRELVVHAGHQVVPLPVDELGADLIGSHAYDRQIRSVRARYRRRRDLLVDVLARFPRLTAAGISAGQHVMVRLPADGPDEAEVLDLAARNGLALSGLAEHWHRPEPGHIKGLIIGYGAPSESGYRPALSVLAEVLGEAYG